MKWLLGLFSCHTFLSVCTIFVTIQAHAQSTDRVALVIGNSDYRVPGGRLKNPLNDAADVAEILRRLNFDVSLETNLDHTKMLKVFDKFLEKTPQYSVRLVYYAGHGIQYNGLTHLVPIDAQIKVEEDLPKQTYKIDQLIDRLDESNERVNIYVFDACRSNPFTHNFATDRDGRAIRLRGSKNSIEESVPVANAKAKPARGGSFVAYAATRGQTSRDTPSKRNSVFTAHLLRYMEEPGLTLDQLFQRVRKGVIDETGRQQVPRDETSLVEPFCFRPYPGQPCGILR